MSESEVKMSYYLDVNSVIEECKKVSICDVVNEAILNSIQANATDIKVKFTTKKENDLFESIKSIEIVDNGEGFNDKNIKHFSTLYTKNKQEKDVKDMEEFITKKHLKWLKYVLLIVMKIIKKLILFLQMMILLKLTI